MKEQISPEAELKHFKAVVRSIMIDASKTLGHIELLSQGNEIEEEISLLDHYLDYTESVCKNDMEEIMKQEGKIWKRGHGRLKPD